MSCLSAPTPPDLLQLNISLVLILRAMFYWHFVGLRLHGRQYHPISDPSCTVRVWYGSWNRANRTTDFLNSVMGSITKSVVPLNFTCLRAWPDGHFSFRWSLSSNVIKVAKIAPKIHLAPIKRPDNTLRTTCPINISSSFVIQIVSTLYRQLPNMSKNSAAHQKKCEHAVRVLPKVPGSSFPKFPRGWLNFQWRMSPTNLRATR